MADNNGFDAGEREGERYQRMLEEKRADQAKLRKRLAFGLLAGFALAGLGILSFINLRAPSPLPAANLTVLRPIEYNFLLPSASYADFQVLAEVNDVAITLEDITFNHRRNGGGFADLTGVERRAAAERVAARVLLAQEAERQGVQKDEGFLAQQKASYLEAMAARVLQQRLARADQVPAPDVRAYVEDNPRLFEGRIHWHFEAVDIDADDYQVIGSDRLLDQQTVADVIALVAEEGRPYRREFFSQFSEQIPGGLLDALPSLQENGDLFITREAGRVRILRIVDADPAPIVEGRRFEVARLKLRAEKQQAILASVEDELLAEIKARLGERATLRYRRPEQKPEDEQSTEPDIE